ncbi:ABC transporter permease protein NatB [Pseudidiomarina piscicola]|uniref:ABC transporter permease protein NatB n=1 Tax=Pseudidiomarina piscicola TaxID=2614830 RepID=A0A6S6WRU4_9GAMM|nr:ABC transporter permease subunit [Pseudidiomarina piscicola]CAB0151088.1 ABC transporter permease protein NatB [Pseudidiomarina piscicola]VZT40596.1 ABC transporter permease protein NatB [Pseudomonas aeruginosa]
MKSPIKIVFGKELKDALRDKRSVMAAMSYAFFGPLLMAVAFYVLISQLTDTSDVKINIEGAEHAPAFVAHLNTQGVVQREEDWPAGQQPITLAISPEWAENVATAQPARVTLTADFSSQKQRTDLRRVERAVETYTAQLSYIRLQMRGIDPKITQGVNLVKHDTATKGSKAAILLGSVLIFILLSVFFSGMNVAIDISAGERERNSLELLLSQPLTTHQLVWGKALAASAFAMFGGVLSAVLIPFIFKLLPLHEIGISIALAWPMILLIMALLIPLALLATALQLFVSFRAKSFKEAQTYISLLLMAPMLVVFGVEFARVKNQILYYLPLTGQHQALLDIIKGESLQWGAMAVSAVATVVLSMLLLRLISRMLSSEKVVFGL